MQAVRPKCYEGKKLLKVSVYYIHKTRDQLLQVQAILISECWAVTLTCNIQTVKKQVAPRYYILCSHPMVGK